MIYKERFGITNGKKKRGSFTGEIGFVLAAAGKCCWTGNLWRFPYLAGTIWQENITSCIHYTCTYLLLHLMTNRDCYRKKDKVKSDKGV